MDWRGWDYSEWNRRLVQYAFGATASSADEPVERIPATPDELVLVAGGNSAEATEVLEAFKGKVRLQVPVGGKSFCGFCRDYRGWDPSSQQIPPFFAMLWLTCLAAYGVPDPKLTFARRMSDLLDKTDNLQSRTAGGEQPICLPSLWTDLEQWLRQQRSRGVRIRELVLPQELGRRTGIGHSWFLAFPHREDRGRLAKLLWDAQLIGFEPPVQRVLEVLDAHRSKFSSGLQEDLKDFKAAYARGEVTARASAFWRAVRQEALSPFLNRDGNRRERSARVELLFHDGEDGLRPLVCAATEWSPPPPFELHALDEPVGPLSHYLRGTDGSLDEPAEEALLRGRLLSLSHRTLVDQGILLLQEVSAEVYRVVSGSEAHGVSLALVRDDLVRAFVDAFHGTRYEGLIDGWSCIAGCIVSISDVIPSGLSHALQLLPTMFPPVITLSGGIRLPGGFLRALHFLPRLHADGAESVFIRGRDGEEHSCQPRRVGEALEWALPPSSVPRSGALVVGARWSPTGGHAARETSTELTFEEETFQSSFKPLPAGVFGVESCLSPEANVSGGIEVDLGVTTANAGHSADLFTLESQARWLGTGVGEMSLQAEPGFEWVAVGSLKHPELLIFVGDPSSPSQPSNAQAESKGGRRHWKNAFTKARRKFVAMSDGSYRSLSEFPAVEKTLSAYGQPRAIAVGARVCSTVDPAELNERPDGLVTSDELTEEAVEAIAALSVRRSGLTHKEVAEILGALVPKASHGEGTDHLSVQQVLRAWTECGQLDVVRQVRSGHLAVVARRPRLVLVRRGPGVEARVIGLLSRVQKARLEMLCETQKISISEVEAPNRWQPSIIRLRGTQAELDGVARDAGFERSEWLHWPSATHVAPHFDVSFAYGKLDSTPPPASYVAQFAWDWERMAFSRDALRRSSGRGVAVERRVHPDGSGVHVVLDDGRVVGWSYLRNWALLFAHDWRGTRVFRRLPNGTLVCRGASPVHLPLPIARLCALTGAGLPGPRFDGKTARVTAYEYPLGRKLSSLVKPVIPSSWVSEEA